MKYSDIRDTFERFHLGRNAEYGIMGCISKRELACAIGMWQRVGAPTDCPHIENRAPSTMIAKGGLSC